MAAKVQYNLPSETYLYEDGVCLTQEGGTYTVMYGRIKDRYADKQSALVRYAQLRRIARALKTEDAIK